MSRKSLVLLAAGSVAIVLVVAMTQAQDSFRRSADSSGGESPRANAKRQPSLTDRLQAAQRALVIEDDEVLPAGGAQPVEGEARPELLDFAPEAAAPAEPLETRENDRAAESLPSVLKRGAAPPTAGGDFSAPARAAPAADAVRRAPIVTAVPEPEAARSAEIGSSSRRTARAPLGAVGRPGGAPGERVSLAVGQLPALRIETIGPAAIKVGQETLYTLEVSNLGEIEAQGVLITIDMPPTVQLLGNNATAGAVRRKAGSGETPLVWELDRVPERGRAQLQLKVLAQDSRPVELGVQYAFEAGKSRARIEVLEPQLTMTLSGPKEILFGETAVYTITLANPGTGDAENVEVSLLPPPGSARAKETSRVGTVPAGQQKQIEIELVGRETGEMQIRVGAEADGGLHGEALANVLVRRANLEVAVDGPKLKYAGSLSTFVVRVANSGNAPAEDVVAAIELPAGAKPVGAAESLKTTGNGLSWKVGKLAPGAERELEIKCELNSAGENRLAVRARGASDLSATADFVTTVEALAELKLSVVEPKGPRSTGDEAVYEIKIQNRGTKAARGVNAIGQFSEGIEPISVEGARAELVPGQALFQPLPRIEAGEELTLRIVARASKEGNHIFRAEIKCNDPETRLVYEGTTRFFAGEATPRGATNSITVPAQKKAAAPGMLQLR